MFNSQPIFVTGLQRTGTTWLAEILETARGIKYIHEPFNWKLHPEALPHLAKYLRQDDVDSEFTAHCARVFQRHALLSSRKRIYKRLPWWPGRLLVKDVHVPLAAEWVDRHIRPAIVIVIRHPCAVAASWLRLGYDPGNILARMFSRPELMEDFLNPFSDVLRSPRTPCEQVAALWGATYHVLLRQRQTHRHWLLVQHEEICCAPFEQYRQCFRQLRLQWTRETEARLKKSTTTDSGKPYTPRRVSSQEPEKWRTELNPEQIERVRRFTVPFHTRCYPDF